ncbi:hypothetical protein D3C75_1368620 [compost metagenome]
MVIGVQAGGDVEFIGIKQLADVLQLFMRGLCALTHIVADVVVDVRARQAMSIFPGFTQGQAVVGVW